ncbi:UDP-2,3-diacylglucosamine diphosphatase [Epibacterium ulvae]|uniref:UDP-2,3-diacylglucosamine pyrophosphatase LpxH n=1 Tax=Epibacterium ulvae TaxID=1156985 RepID=A0A1G5QWQ3_9RHOB|nr:UDP-2,3-diacylglucosamine diphosphatase [Epibacterium ulvae]SCZ66177.1 UDP-2,3-diacylglucosamine pyrophosphatase LpxH [Epibacterium ulvae]
MSYRTLFLSDLHLGTRGCQADLLMDFLGRYDAETIYLVGDIFDGWKLQRGWHWPQRHNDVVQAFLKKAQEGTRIVFVPGNHDEVMRSYLGTHFGGIEVAETADFIAQDGRRYLVTHGDQFDVIVKNARWLALLGDRAYELLIWCNPRLNKIRRLWSKRYWSLSKWAKAQVKQAVNFIGKFEETLAEDARQGGYDGVICGHIHHANIRMIDDIHYLNTGDWVESCTAIVEDADGTLRLIDWEAAIARRHKLARKVSRSKSRKTKELT